MSEPANCLLTRSDVGHCGHCGVLVIAVTGPCGDRYLSWRPTQQDCTHPTRLHEPFRTPCPYCQIGA